MLTIKNEGPRAVAVLTPGGIDSVASGKSREVAEEPLNRAALEKARGVSISGEAEKAPEPAPAATAPATPAPTAPEPPAEKPGEGPSASGRSNPPSGTVNPTPVAAPQASGAPEPAPAAKK